MAETDTTAGGADRLDLMQYTVVIEPADDGSLSVWVPDLPGCASCGDTRDEAIVNIADAIRGHIETLRSDGEPVPAPRSVATVVQAA
jgi:predicted RNase H-like HicB family nuclease